MAIIFAHICNKYQYSVQFTGTPILQRNTETALSRAALEGVLKYVCKQLKKRNVNLLGDTVGVEIYANLTTDDYNEIKSVSLKLYFYVRFI